MSATDSLQSKIDILKDLIHFQVFLLMSMDRNEKIKSYHSKYAWREFLLESKKDIKKLQIFDSSYFYENKIQEDDTEQWCFKAAWIGRSQGNYKCHPEFLYKNLDSLEEGKNYLLEDMKELTGNMGPSSGV